MCSTFFSTLQSEDSLEAGIQINKDFHLPKASNTTILIANGTGIAPFLGMIMDNNNTSTKHLFWGGRTKKSLALYEKYLHKARQSNSNLSFNAVYSREETQHQKYVQHSLSAQKNTVLETLKSGGTIMICGSIAMQTEVIALLEELCNTQLKIPLSTFQQKNQIKLDCY